MKGILCLAAFIALLCYGWLFFLHQTTGEGRPVCFSNLTQPSREAIIRQGVWSHLQALPAIREVVEGRAIEGSEGNLTRGDPEAPIDLAAVDGFLSKHPDCCRIGAPGEGMGKLNRAAALLYSRQFVYVSVEDPTLKSEAGNQIYGSGYPVDACSDNLEK
ncbi:MAG: hypothetical protein ACK5NN_01585 [Sphingomonadaceae bacterium]